MILILAIFYIISCIKIVKEYERAVIFRLGRVLKTPKGPGIFFVLWPIDKMTKVSLRTVTLDVPPQDIITKDNVSVKVNAVVYYRIMDPIKAVIEVEDYDFATSQISQTTLRSVVGQVELDELLSNRGWDFSVRLLIPLVLIIILINSLIKEFSSPYGGYSVLSLILIGRDWLIFTLFLALIVAGRTWKIEPHTRLQH